VSGENLEGVLACTCSYGAPGRVDVQVNGLFWVVGFEEEELGDYRCRYGLINLTIEANYSLLSLY